MLNSEPNTVIFPTEIFVTNQKNLDIQKKNKVTKSAKNHISCYVMFISNTTVNGLTTADQIFCHNNKYQSIGPNSWQISTFSIGFFSSSINFSLVM